MAGAARRLFGRADPNTDSVAAIDAAIRKVVASQAPYPAFLPAVARQYDVIEIRRTWIFDTAIRLQ